MLTRDEWMKQDLVGLAALVETGALSPREVLLTAIREIEAANPKVNAVVVQCFEEALAELDAREAAPRFLGMPYLAKDLHAPVRGLPLANGSRRFKDQVFDFDSTMFARIRAAGFGILGRTNSPEFGLSISTEPELWGPTRNPWSPERSAGGSSGGAGAAVAAGMLPAAHATDSAGSIRIPASCNGLVGLKPTRGLNPFGPHRGDPSHGISHEHALTRSVRDCAVLLDITAGPDVGAPYFTQKPASSFESLIERPPSSLRIGFTTHTFDGGDAHPECVAAVEKTAALLAEMGHRVSEAAPNFDAPLLADTMIRILIASLAAMFPADEAGDDAGLEPLTRAAIAFARETSLAEHLARTVVMNREARRLSAFWEEFDILVTPTIASPPIPLGALDTSVGDLDLFLKALFDVSPFVAPFNTTGQPAISLPMHMTPDRLPVGVQLVGRFGRDDTLLSLSRALEIAAPWPTLSRAV
ncbi:amidase [Pikeienuella sp. HZG-20]|uniref:amidase n=1 Tax=Paludibacillus litoralis TaxID=3133267 RepID=UPI0030EB9194